MRQVPETAQIAAASLPCWLFNSTGNTKSHDDCSYQNCDDKPAVISKSGSSTIEQTTNGPISCPSVYRFPLSARNAYLKISRLLLYNRLPAPWSPEPGSCRSALPPVSFGPKLCAHFKGLDGAALGRTSQRHLLDHAGRSDQNHKHQIGKQKCHATPV